ncbi:hypothetical protein DIPPA_01974 [Diplonema papillatum]|nr:hypothetical protein DIPPA_01974 [Diplonema papillatum]
MCLLLMSYTIVADDALPILFASIQVASLISLYPLGISLGKVGYIVTDCKDHVWADSSDNSLHHCAASTMQFVGGIFHSLGITAVFLENMTHL